MNTERIDARKLSAPAREQMRKIVLRLHAQGYGSTTIAQMLGLRRPTVSEWLTRVRKGLGTGERKRGRRVGTGRRLSEAQESRILREITPHTLKTGVFLDFLKRLVQDSERKIFLVLDNHKVHHSRKVRQWVADHPQQIELCFLPPYSPDLNPGEYLNAELKARLHAGEPVKDADHLKRKLLSHLRSIQKQPEKVRRYFQAKSICYAAA